MKIFLKTITGKMQDLDVSATTTILDIKKTLESEYDISTLRLCYKGAILADTVTVEDAKMAENATLIITGKKCSIPKPPQPSSPTTSGTIPSASADPTTHPGVSPEVQPSPQPIPEPRAATAAVAPTPLPPARVNPDSTSDVSSGLIDGIVAMGFEDRAQVSLALRAAFMNPDRAVEYLCTGIPPNLLRELSHPTQPVADPATTPTPTSVAATRSSNVLRAVSSVQPAPGASELRTALWTIPQFENIRAVFQSNQASFPVVIEQIRDRYPNIFQLIEANQEEFLQVMNETAGQPGNPMTTGASGNITDTVPVELQLTASDQAAVQQLVELGAGMWDEQSALMVYLATQRNQEIAANVLFENGGIPPNLLEQFAADLRHLGDEDNDEPGDMEEEPK
ncbi:unnamed protein product [Phytomonas sp. EM1]|nr:unnamed protein product [Phytomonas sp. EM1]|eukprot:CCW61521.1 unnamed protein product [Phytomonas sp. isolate EM1]